MAFSYRVAPTLCGAKYSGLYFCPRNFFDYAFSSKNLLAIFLFIRAFNDRSKIILQSYKSPSFVETSYVVFALELPSQSNLSPLFLLFPKTFFTKDFREPGMSKGHKKAADISYRRLRYLLLNCRHLRLDYVINYTSFAI